MYIDIYNAVMRLPVSFYPVPDNPGVGSVRAAQNQLAPDMITRVVFDLKDGAEYSVTMSPDRTEIYVNFLRNTIYSVIVVPEGGFDSVVITGEFTPSVSVSPGHNIEMLYIDIPHASAYSAYDQPHVNGRFVTGMNMETVDGAVRVTLTLTESTMYDIKTDQHSTTVRLFGRTYQNIEYDMAQKRIVIKKSPYQPIDIHAFTHEDNYTEFKYTIRLGGDYSMHLGNGDYTIRDGLINSVRLRTDNGQTYLEINETGIFAYNVYEDNEHVYIQPVHPKQRHGNIVIIDPGHGGSDDGTSGYGMLEKMINLDISNRVMALFERDYRVKAYATRIIDINPDYDERIEFGTNLGDLFISVHNNFAPVRSGSRQPNPVPSGTETFFYPHDYDAYLGISSEAAAGIVQRNVVRGFGSADRGAKQTRYYVLANARIPAVLLEIGFLSNEADSQKLASDEYRQRIAEAIYYGVIEIFDNYTPVR